MNKTKISLIINIIIVISVTIGTVMMITGIHFMPDTLALEVKGFHNLKFFTVDSNIFIGITSFITLIYEILLIKGKIKTIPKYVYILRHVSTTSITLTFLVTLFFLGPTIETGFFSLYTNSNLFFHLIVPLLGIISYIFLDKYDNKYSYSLYAIIPIILYSLYYLPNVLLHLDNGKTTLQYDFYGFFHGNPYNVFIYYPLLLLVGYGIATLLYTFNTKLLKNK